MVWDIRGGCSSQIRQGMVKPVVDKIDEIEQGLNLGFLGKNPKEILLIVQMIEEKVTEVTKEEETFLIGVLYF